MGGPESQPTRNIPKINGAQATRKRLFIANVLSEMESKESKMAAQRCVSACFYMKDDLVGPLFQEE
jgi:hypothetical protein